jgi:anti-sigma factor RsiW
MTCEELRELLDGYVDGELGLVNSLQFERHLKDCPACAALSRRYKQLRSVVQAKAPYFEAPMGLEEKIRGQFLRTGRTNDKPGYRDFFWNWRAWAIAASLIVAAVVSLVLFTLTRRTSTTELLADDVVSSHVRSLMADHLGDVVSTDQHTVKPWFSGKLDFAPVVKDLASRGFPLIAGRLDYLDDRPVAALVYKHRQHTINLFSWPSAASDTSPRTMTARGYNIVHWTQAQMNYWAVSDLNPTELNEFARLFAYQP